MCMSGIKHFDNGLKKVCKVDLGEGGLAVAVCFHPSVKHSFERVNGGQRTLHSWPCSTIR